MMVAYYNFLQGWSKHNFNEVLSRLNEGQKEEYHFSNNATIKPTQEHPTNFLGLHILSFDFKL